MTGDPAVQENFLPFGNNCMYTNTEDEDEEENNEGCIMYQPYRGMIGYDVVCPPASAAVRIFAFREICWSLERTLLGGSEVSEASEPNTYHERRTYRLPSNSWPWTALTLNYPFSITITAHPRSKVRGAWQSTRQNKLMLKVERVTDSRNGQTVKHIYFRQSM